MIYSLGYEPIEECYEEGEELYFDTYSLETEGEESSDSETETDNE